MPRKLIWFWMIAILILLALFYLFFYQQEKKKEMPSGEVYQDIQQSSGKFCL